MGRSRSEWRDLLLGVSVASDRPCSRTPTAEAVWPRPVANLSMALTTGDRAQERAPAFGSAPWHGRLGDLGADLVGARKTGRLAVTKVAAKSHQVPRQPPDRGDAGHEETEICGGTPASSPVPEPPVPATPPVPIRPQAPAIPVRSQTRPTRPTRPTAPPVTPAALRRFPTAEPPVPGVPQLNRRSRAPPAPEPPEPRGLRHSDRRAPEPPMVVLAEEQPRRRNKQNCQRGSAIHITPETSGEDRKLAMGFSFHARLAFPSPSCYKIVAKNADAFCLSACHVSRGGLNRSRRNVVFLVVFFPV